MLLARVGSKRGWTCTLFNNRRYSFTHRKNQIDFSHVNSLCMKGDYPLILSYVNELHEDGAILSPESYHKLFNTLRSHQKHGLAIKLFHQVKEKILEPDINLYNKIIDSLRRQGQIKEISQLFEEMQAQKILPDVTTYNTLIATNANLKRFDMCFELFNNMKKQNLQPTEVTYNTLIHAALKEKLHDLVIQYYNELQQTYGANERTCAIIVSDLLHSCQVERAEAVSFIFLIFFSMLGHDRGLTVYLGSSPTLNKLLYYFPNVTPVFTI